MKHQLINWKNVICRGYYGQLVALPVPFILDIRLRHTLLSGILSMPSKKPISFETAIRLMCYKQRQALKTGQYGNRPGHYGWYYLNFVDWISALGYHIELTGEEFEAQVANYKIPNLS
jgi:hypothetical protein